MIFIANYVDYNLIARNKAENDKIFELLWQEEFNLKIEDNLGNYLSQNIHFSSSKKQSMSWSATLDCIFESEFWAVRRENPNVPSARYEVTKLWSI